MDQKGHTTMSLSKLLRGLWWNTSFRRWVVASLLLYKASLGLVSAVPDLTPIFTYQKYGSCEWRLDDTLQITDQPNDYVQGTTRFLYDLQTEILTPQGGLTSAFSLLKSMNRVLPAV